MQWIDGWRDIEFANPELFWLLLLLPGFWLYYFLKQRSMYPEIKFSAVQVVNTGSGLLRYLAHIPFILRNLVYALLIVALARPQSVFSKEKVSTDGIDIVLAIDISSSMLAQDFHPNRLESAKEVAIEFVKGRPNDRIGLVVFSGESFTQCPVTTDHEVVTRAISELESGIIEDGTAIGMGLATSCDRLKDSDSKSKVVILLTDGVNNQGIIDPKTAAEIAKSLNVRVYTIGVGSMGTAPYPVTDMFGNKRLQNVKVEIDEELLQYIASLTGVDYYRATDESKLKDIFKKIDKLEKTRIEVSSFRRVSERFLPFALAALLLLMLEIFFRNVFIKILP